MPTDSQSTNSDKTDITTPQELENAPLGHAPSEETPDSTSIVGSKPKLPEASTSQDAHAEFAELSHNYVREYIKIADQKAAFFFAASTALIAFLQRGGFLEKWLVNPKGWGIYEVMCFLATIGLSVCILLCLWVVIPRLKGSIRGLIFFNAVAEYETSKEYISDVKRRNSSELVEALLKHTHELCLICKNKYQALTKALWAGAVGVSAAIFIFITGV